MNRATLPNKQEIEMTNYFRNNYFPTVHQLVEELKKLDPDTRLAQWVGGCCLRKNCPTNYAPLGLNYYKDGHGEALVCTPGQYHPSLHPGERDSLISEYVWKE